VTGQRIGFIGLGAMGAPMAARLLRCPGTLAVFDPVAARRDSVPTAPRRCSRLARWSSS